MVGSVLFWDALDVLGWGELRADPQLEGAADVGSREPERSIEHDNSDGLVLE
jgi:hypothetical protein